MNTRPASADIDYPRPPRSFVRREGRLTRAQAGALQTLLPQYAIPRAPLVLDFKALYAREAPIWCEIGFGNGTQLLNIARQRPDVNLLGLEIHRPGVGCLLQGLAREGISSVRILVEDAFEVFSTRIPQASLTRVLVLFPDPWPKKRHHKRRLIGSQFVDYLARSLHPDGVLHLATDCSDYAATMQQVVHTSGAFEVCNKIAIDYPIETRFHARARDQGVPIHQYLFRRRTTGDKSISQ